jgi:hypothetical protein
MKHDDLDLFSDDDEEKQDAGITFWFTKSVKAKYDQLGSHKKKRKIIARIKRAAAKEIETLFAQLSS